MRKLIVWIAVVVVVAGGAAFAGLRYWAPSQAAVEPAMVAVQRGDVEQTVLASGALQANSVTSVGAEVSGTIQTLSVKLGDIVKKGDPIAQIDSVNQENAVKSAEASLANMKAQLSAKQADLKTAQAAMDRSDKLAAQNLLSDADRLRRKQPSHPLKRQSRGSRRRSASPSSPSTLPSSTSSAPRSPHRSVGRSWPCSSLKARASTRPRPRRPSSRSPTSIRC
jgi:multidrug efflux pump subunit AcrA (membrane-fusion protein)